MNHGDIPRIRGIPPDTGMKYPDSMARIRLDEAREELGLSRRQFAIKLGYAGRHVNRLFSPDYNPRFSTLAEYAEKLDLPLSSLIDDERPSKPSTTRKRKT